MAKLRVDVCFEGKCHLRRAKVALKLLGMRIYIAINTKVIINLERSIATNI
jgi:hypothetical protein